MWSSSGLLKTLVVLAALGCGGREPDPARDTARTTVAPAPTVADVTPTPDPTPIDSPPTPLARALVKLITLGEFEEELLDSVEAGLRDELQVDVERIDRVPLPREAFYPPRHRYRADRLLDFLDAHLEGEPATTRVLGMTNVDISTTKGAIQDWGVLGLGNLGGRSCVISTHRMRRRMRDAAHLRFRAVSTAIHEVGHTLGLEHCVEPRCVMNDARGTIDTVDNSTGHLGPECRDELEAREPQRLPYLAPTTSEGTQLVPPP